MLLNALNDTFQNCFSFVGSQLQQNIKWNFFRPIDSRKQNQTDWKIFNFNFVFRFSTLTKQKMQKNFYTFYSTSSNLKVKKIFYTFFQVKGFQLLKI